MKANRFKIERLHHLPWTIHTAAVYAAQK